jgi:alkanesulfonate monooxygenase SsuD/methylene tetrahydromethanopterin reductase-like flavin-dependent oxidoreductase (luciferase family)
VHEACVRPGAVQSPRVPIAIAAAGAKTLALVARHGDAWITYGDPSAEDAPAKTIEAAVGAQARRLDDACAAIGRDPATVRRIYLIGNTSERPIASAEAFRDFAGRYAALGFTDLVFHHPRPGDSVWNEPESIVEAIATEVLDGLHA